MTATIMIHNAKPPIACELAEASSLHFDTPDGGYACIFMPFHVAEAMVAAFNAASVPQYDALLSFVEEVRDHKPTVVFRSQVYDPQDECDDLMPVNEFEAFRDDAETLIGKRQKAGA